MSRSPIHTRSDYRFSCTVSTRWMDNDVYGHVNNVVYYSWIDTAVGTFLLENGLIDVEKGPIIGMAVDSGCQYNREVSFPQRVTAMVRIGHIGTSSVRYEIGLFADNEETASAQGHFVHVYVNRSDRRPRPIPETWRTVLAPLLV
ncbi:thioesterase family protein [Novosphingobium aquae]|uniref:Thioesterase family protein n=1 Tax=Novosphingobium aquae TaxID=3133435 RepID=A0ABU8S6B0_9SPHN